MSLFPITQISTKFEEISYIRLVGDRDLRLKVAEGVNLPGGKIKNILTN